MAREMLSAWKAVSAEQEEVVAGIRADCRQLGLSPQGRRVDAAPRKPRWAVQLGGGRCPGDPVEPPRPSAHGGLAG